MYIPQAARYLNIGQADGVKIVQAELYYDRIHAPQDMIKDAHVIVDFNGQVLHSEWKH